MALFFRILLVSPVILFWAISSTRADDAIINKARGYLGSEADLAVVRALRFKGELSVAEGKSLAPITAKLEIIFQQPDRQLIIATTPEKIETTALNGYEAWQVEAVTDKKSTPRVSLLGRDSIKRLRANTFENISFYRGISSVGGRIEDRGKAKVDGVDCIKIAFIHASNVIFVRSFDRRTGRLILTETDNGSEIREYGEIRAGSLRFPQRIVTSSILPNGSKRIITITYNEITVNPKLPDTLFVIPSLAMP
jgi:outer membrane lipoprotein-sorting protein